jgi:hypothetical protein
MENVRPKYTPFVIDRCRPLWKFDENRSLRPKDEKGEIIFGSDPPTPMTMREQIAGFRKEFPEWFAQPEGSGASNTGASQGNRQPWVLTEDEARDTQRYRQAKKAATEAGQEVKIVANR